MRIGEVSLCDSPARCDDRPLSLPRSRFLSFCPPPYDGRALLAIGGPKWRAKFDQEPKAGDGFRLDGESYRVLVVEIFEPSLVRRTLIGRSVSDQAARALLRWTSNGAQR